MVGRPQKTDMVFWEGSWLRRTGEWRAKGRPSFKRGSHHDSIWCCYWGVLPATYFLWKEPLDPTVRPQSALSYLLANVCLWHPMNMSSVYKLKLRWASKAWQDGSGFAHSFEMLWFFGVNFHQFLCLRFCHRRQVFSQLFSCEANAFDDFLASRVVGLAVYAKQHPSPFASCQSGGNDTSCQRSQRWASWNLRRWDWGVAAFLSLSLCKLKNPSLQDEDSSGRHSRDVQSPSGWRYLH